MTVQMHVMELFDFSTKKDFLINIWQISWMRKLSVNERIPTKDGDRNIDGTMICTSDGQKIYSTEDFNRIVLSVGWTLASSNVEFDGCKTIELPPIKMEQNEQIR